MAGLDFRVGAGANVAAAPARVPTTATEAAFGPASAPASSLTSVLVPNDPAGVAFWVGVVGVVGLVLLYHSLPR